METGEEVNSHSLTIASHLQGTESGNQTQL